jgi:IS1 family transposase/lambda repressor-like predicted transcriptional regulator
MNKLPLEKRAQILHLLVEGSSMRAISRITGVSINTVTKLLEDAGEACIAMHDERVRGVKSHRIECDEIWSFNYCKRVSVATAKAAPANAGDVWTWTAIDRDSKLIVSYLVGDRDAGYAHEFMQDVSERVANRIQLTTDGHRPYLEAVEGAFGLDVDYAMLIKTYGETPDIGGPERKYSPGVCTGVKGRKVTGRPDARYVSTSFVETHNQKMRQHMRRFTRLTAGHSKKFANHCHALALYFAYYNFVKIHSSLLASPAMAAGIEKRLWEMTDIVALIDARETAPKRPATYRKAADGNGAEISN